VATYSSAKSNSLPIALALLRLLFLYAALCYILLEIGFVSRRLIEAAPFWPQSSSAFAKDAYPGQLAGVNVALEQYVDSGQRRAALEKLVVAGFGWVRQRADWRAMEPVPGQYEWGQMDDILADVAVAGLDVVVVLDGSPAWARAPQDRAPTDNPFAPPADAADFARFATAFALRYGEQVRFYQIWDEPNIAPHWGNRLIEPVAYGRLLAQVAPAVRAADADAVILLAALAPTADRGHTAIDEAYYLQRLYAAGAAPYFDAVAAQPFGFGLAPDDSRSRVELLNFQRMGLLRRVMVAAGDGAKPVWAVRYGWNRSTNGLWRTVTGETQARYVEQANALAKGWPWLAGLAWANDRPAVPADDPLWGFALYTPQGTSLSLWNTFGLVNRSLTVAATSDPRSLLAGLLFWLSALLAVLWRGWRAGETAGVAHWPARFALLPVPVKITAWLLLATVYYFATWPPLIGLCYLIAAFFLAAQPLLGLVLVGLLLPFHYQHKDVQLVGAVLAVPPAYAVLLCSLPGLLGHWLVGTYKQRTRLFSTDWLALGWLVASLLSAGATWQWSWTPGSFWWLAGGPLLMYALGRTVSTTPKRRGWAVGTLAVGAVLSALIGMALWWTGEGTVVDGLRRLVGLTFSPNQTALMLVRGLFVCLGFVIASRGYRRWFWSGGVGVIALALLLTGSRGALLLGIPTGAALLLVLQPGIRRGLQRQSWLVPAAMAVLLAGAVFLLGGRLLNSATVAQRWYIWQGALDMWLAYPWLGNGPGGFFWHYPAFMTAAAANEPNLLHPHNLWLEFLTGWGLPGLAWVFALIYWLGRRTIGRSGKVSGVEAGLLAAIVAGMAHGQVDAFGALPELAAWNWLVIGLLRKEG